MSGPAMMGGQAEASSQMMGSGGYHFSTSTCAAPSDLPGTTVQVMLGDMGLTRMMTGTPQWGAHMMLRTDVDSVPEGEISVVAANRGWRTHELVILSLPDGQSAGRRAVGPDGRVDESGSLGEASSSCAGGAGDGITAGSVGWTTVTLAPGRYEVLCNLPQHYGDGMWQELDVT
jgi:uncharacterized cupredoxin-like copper-binding protein